jgi:putative transposase
VINPFQRRDLQKLEARRFAAIARFKRGESNSEIARNLGVRVQTVQRWMRFYRLNGMDGLRYKKTGAPPKLPREKLARPPEMLEKGPLSFGFRTPVWNSKRITNLLWTRFRVRYSVDHVKRLLPTLGCRWRGRTWVSTNPENRGT